MLQDFITVFCGRHRARHSFLYSHDRSHVIHSHQETNIEFQAFSIVCLSCWPKSATLKQSSPTTRTCVGVESRTIKPGRKISFADNVPSFASSDFESNVSSYKVLSRCSSGFCRRGHPDRSCFHLVDLRCGRGHQCRDLVRCSRVRHLTRQYPASSLV